MENIKNHYLYIAIILFIVMIIIVIVEIYYCYYPHAFFTFGFGIIISSIFLQIWMIYNGYDNLDNKRSKYKGMF